MSAFKIKVMAAESSANMSLIQLLSLASCAALTIPYAC